MLAASDTPFRGSGRVGIATRRDRRRSANFNNISDGTHRGGNIMRSRPRQVLCAVLGVLLTAGTAAAQAPATPPGALAPEAIQPWGLPPPPPGVGPVDCSRTSMTPRKESFSKAGPSIR